MRRAMVLVFALALGAAVIGISGPADASGPTVGPAREAGPAIDGDTNPAAKIGTAFDGTNQLLVWTRLQPGTGHSGDIMAARVAPDGTVLDPGRLRGGGHVGRRGVRRCELRRHEL